MKDNPLKVVSTDSKVEGWVSSKTNYRQEAQAKFERLWHLYPLQFNPSRNIMEQERVERTVDFIQKHMDLNGKKVADLGCGKGELTKKVRDLGAEVDAIDIAGNAFDPSDSENITFTQDYVPRTKLPDDTYDLVIASELIAYLHPDEFRLFMAEMSRIVKADGRVVCSTPLDINSDDCLMRFHGLSETEFQIDDWKVSHYRLWIRIHDFFAAPERFVKAYRNRDYRALKLDQREGLSKFWFKINSLAPLVYIWTLFQWITKPISRAISHSKSLLLGLERMCKAISSVRGITHVVWFGKRRPLVEHTKIEDQPQERKGKKQVWE